MMISDAEKVRRKKIIEESNFSIGLEGFKVTQWSNEIANDYIEGKITLDELGRQTVAKYGND